MSTVKRYQKTTIVTVLEYTGENDEEIENFTELTFDALKKRSDIQLKVGNFIVKDVEWGMYTVTPEQLERDFKCLLGF